MPMYSRLTFRMTANQLDQLSPIRRGKADDAISSGPAAFIGNSRSMSLNRLPHRSDPWLQRTHHANSCLSTPNRLSHQRRAGKPLLFAVLQLLLGPWGLSGLVRLQWFLLGRVNAESV
jgi:hypothetical protein